MTPAGIRGGGALVARAPGKVNRTLLVGATREDGLHPLVSIVQPVSLADELTLTPADGGADAVTCPGVEGPNLVETAIDAFRRATGWDGPPVHVHVAKRVPVAAGMGGGSGDAAAALRLLAAHSGLPLPAQVAMELGADVPSQLAPGRCLMWGAGEHVAPLPAGPPEAYLVVPSAHGLSTPAVFREYDRLGLARAELPAPAEPLPEVNDLEPAALSLLPEIRERLDALRTAGAVSVMVSGSGPTVYGVFATAAAASRAAAQIPGSIVAGPVGAGYGEPYTRDA